MKMLAEDQNVPSASSEDAVASPTGPIKSYDNKQWLHSRGAREVRILCEYLEVRDRLRANGVLSSFVVFGSARAMDRHTWEHKMEVAKSAISSADAAVSAEAEATVAKLMRLEWTCEWYEKTRQLAKKLMEWVQTEEARMAIGDVLREIPLTIAGDEPSYLRDQLDGLKSGSFCAAALCTGGGPGLMEAANRGAYDVPGARSMGFGMTLPFENNLNRYIDRELMFQFHYFFTRKFWMTYAAIAVIAAPGGFGTLDELMELLTLKQCRKLKRDIPIILFGKTFWQKVVNFDYLVETGMVGAKDRDNIFFTDDVDEAFAYLRDVLVSRKLLLGGTHFHKSMRNRRSLAEQCA